MGATDERDEDAGLRVVTPPRSAAGLPAVRHAMEHAGADGTAADAAHAASGQPGARFRLPGLRLAGATARGALRDRVL
jgi:hypothetical protein